MIDCLNIETHIAKITKSAKRETLRKHRWYLRYENCSLVKYLRQRELLKSLSEQQRRRNEITKLKLLLIEYNQNIEKGHL